MTRSTKIWLPDKEPRCAPSQPCVQKDGCGRYLAALPKSGATIGDFSLELSPYSYLLGDGCNYLVAPRGKPADAAAGPTVHEPVKGIS